MSVHRYKNRETLIKTFVTSIPPSRQHLLPRLQAQLLAGVHEPAVRGGPEPRPRPRPCGAPPPLPAPEHQRQRDDGDPGPDHQGRLRGGRPRRLPGG